MSVSSETSNEPNPLPAHLAAALVGLGCGLLAAPRRWPGEALKLTLGSVKTGTGSGIRWGWGIGRWGRAGVRGRGGPPYRLVERAFLGEVQGAMLTGMVCGEKLR